MDMNKDVWRRLFELEGLEYAVFTRDGCLNDHSPGLHEFLYDEDQRKLQGRLLEDLFPEIIGYDDVLNDVYAGKQNHLLIERIQRDNLRGRPGFITLRLTPHNGGWLLAASDATEVGLMERRITQQRNDLSLLADRLEITRARLDDLLHRFMPEKVADALLASDKAVQPGGVRREVTVLFADLRGFSSWSAAYEPEVLLAALNSIFDDVLDVLLAHDATLDKFIGDAVMAFFNAPDDQPDHARRALACARQIRDLPLGSSGLRFGIGINTGAVVAGNVGSARAMQYSIIGDTVNVAKHLEALARPGEVLVGQNFIDAIGDRLPRTTYGQFPLKGRLEPVTIYKLLE